MLHYYDIRILHNYLSLCNLLLNPFLQLAHDFFLSVLTQLHILTLRKEEILQPQVLFVK
jgi:hypothetical protein